MPSRLKNIPPIHSRFQDKNSKMTIMNVGIKCKNKAIVILIMPFSLKTSKANMLIKAAKTIVKTLGVQYISCFPKESFFATPRR